MGRKGSGVEVRETSIRVKFTVDGNRIAETLRAPGGAPLPPTAANEKRAHKVAEAVQRHLDNGTWGDAAYAEFFPDSPALKKRELAPTTVGALLDLWHQSQGRLTGATKDQYGTAVRFWKRLLGAATPVKAITHKVAAAKIGGYPWRSAKQHNNYLIALRGAMALEYRGAQAVHNPLADIKNMKRVKKLPDPFTAAERDAILADLQARYDVRVYAYFLFMFFTGMRPEEAIALQWGDVDWNRRMIRVQRVRTFKGSERDGSKTHADRDVDLVPQALAALQLMKPLTFLKRDTEGNPVDLFENPVTGRPWHDERSQRDHYWKPALKRLGIRYRTSYKTRHTFLSIALSGGVRPAYLAEQAGHSLKMLLEVYAKFLPDADGTERDQMAAAMAGSSAIVPAVSLKTEASR
jgi:integrase